MASSLLWDLGLRGLVFVKAHTPFSVRVPTGRHDWVRKASRSVAQPDLLRTPYKPLRSHLQKAAGTLSKKK